MDRKIFQLRRDDNEDIGLYSVPPGTTESEFLNEFNKFDDQNEFDDDNKINAIREFVDVIYTDNPF